MLLKKSTGFDSGVLVQEAEQAELGVRDRRLFLFRIFLFGSRSALGGWLFYLPPLFAPLPDAAFRLELLADKLPAPALDEEDGGDGVTEDPMAVSTAVKRSSFPEGREADESCEASEKLVSSLLSITTTLVLAMMRYNWSWLLQAGAMLITSM